MSSGRDKGYAASVVATMSSAYYALVRRRGMTAARGYPSDMEDDEWALATPYLALLRQDAPQRLHPLRAPFNAPRYRGHTGGQGRCLPNDLPPWAAAY